MEREKQARRIVDRVMLAFSLHLLILLCTALVGVPSYSFFGICLLLVRFLFPISLLLLPKSGCTMQLFPAMRRDWLDLFPAWGLLLLTGLLIPGGSSALPNAPLPLVLFQLVVLTPILEELLFRGIPLALCKHFDKRAVLLLLSLLFALMHSGFTKGYALIAGLVIGGALLLGRGLLFGIALHACNNLFSALCLLLKQYAPAYYLPFYYGFVAIIVSFGAFIAFLRLKSRCYRLPLQEYDSEDGKPLSLAKMVTPLSALLLICFLSVTILL